MDTNGMGMWLSRGSSDIVSESVEEGLKLLSLKRNKFQVENIMSFVVENDVAVLVVGRNLRAKGRVEIRLGHSRCNFKSGDSFDVSRGFETAFKRAVRESQGKSERDQAYTEGALATLNQFLGAVAEARDRILS